MGRKVILALLCLLFLGIALYSGYQLFHAWQEYEIGRELYDDLTQYIQIEPTAPVETTAPTAAPTEPSQPSEGPAEPTDAPTEPQETTAPTEPEEVIAWPVVDFEALLEINPDVIGWIYIEGTNINYPVVQGEDNDYYLYRLVDKTYNVSGSIFMDYRSDRDFSDQNTIIHGHHMRNDTMFAHITEYRTQEYYEAHPYALFMTPNGNYKLEFISGYVTEHDSNAWKMRFSSDQEYSAWLDQTVRKSYFASDVSPTVQDRVVTLSTCTYEYDNARFVLIGVLRPA